MTNTNTITTTPPPLSYEAINNSAEFNISFGDDTAYDYTPEIIATYDAAIDTDAVALATTESSSDMYAITEYEDEYELDNEEQLGDYVVANYLGDYNNNNDDDNCNNGDNTNNNNEGMNTHKDPYFDEVLSLLLFDNEHQQQQQQQQQEPVVMDTTTTTTTTTIQNGRRCFIRPSGTEDIVRIYAEANTREDAERLAILAAQIVYDECNGIGERPVL
mmetsp:Transcript_2820/g.3266  ORF Transcript_2820/g.3266 Transcript_2820/m.3266 type:complete len:217 (+) Transcript_2820:394-1044(+)